MIKSALHRFASQPSALVGAVVVALLVAAVLVGPMVDPQSAIAVNHATMGYPQPPDRVHLLGTDILGRDVLARAMLGGRVSIAIGVTAMLVAVLFGTLYGAIAGAAGGAVDAVMMRIVDALFSFPTFFLIITVEALTNQFAVGVIVLILGLLSWMGVARLVRAEVLSLRSRDFIEAARALGVSPARLVLRHLIPNALAPVIVAATLAIGDNILAETGLSYLGLGVQPPTPSWGNMLQDALLPAARNAPWMIATPGILIVLTLVAFALVGDGLRAAIDVVDAQSAASTVDLEAEAA
ncbi:MAG: ABC transporter permease [Candidatus Eremiobacteraeota bacterium]|nr:ABC transporter permease [Candidatus Eremiobacteraeota bacterium]